MSVRDLIMAAASISPVDVIGGLIFRLDASNTATISLSGGGVTGWSDTVGGLVFANSTGLRRPSYDTSNLNLQKNCVNFASSKILSLASTFTSGVAFTAFMAGHYPAGNANAYSSITLNDTVNQQNSPFGAFGLYKAATPTPALSVQALSRTPTYNYVYADNVGPVVGPFAFVGVTSSTGVKGQAIARCNGTTQTVSAGNTMVGPITFNKIGTESGDLYVSYGSVGEVLIYNRALSLLEIQSIEAYLKIKWGTN